MTAAADVTPKCPHCGALPHPAKCPLVKAIEYFENGMVKRVEYYTPADYMPPLSSVPAWPQWPQAPYNPHWSCQ